MLGRYWEFLSIKGENSLELRHGDVRKYSFVVVFEANGGLHRRLDFVDDAHRIGYFLLGWRLLSAAAS